MIEKIKEILNKKWNIVFFEELSKTLSSFKLTEKVFFYLLVGIFIVSGIILLNRVSNSYTIDVPSLGGSLKEGIVGTPRFINPVLAVSDVDRDLTDIIYSGLIKIGPENILEPDLAESYKISKDGLVYSFILKENIYFHDGKKLTSDDVEFTINKIQDGAIKSPLRPEFYDVQVEKINDKEINFILKKPYAPFLKNLTVGILPKHLWVNLSSEEFPLSQYNLQPIGSGPYKIKTMGTTKKDMLLIPTYYELESFDKYALGRAYIKNITINLYRDEKSLIDAYNKGDIEALNSISPDKMNLIKKKNETAIKLSPLPKEFMIFFNQNQSEVLSYQEIRQALDMVIDRDKLVLEVLNGYGTPIYGPIPANLLEKQIIPKDYNFENAKTLLEKKGWFISSSTGILTKKINSKKSLELSISISTLNSPNLEKAAKLIKSDWEKIGAKVEIKQFDFGSLEQNIIRPRKFDALLYGLVIGRDMDFFAFWHSSQRNDPGLNISMYANSKVDKILEDARKIIDDSVRLEKYKTFENELKKDIPAIFLYCPDFIYIAPKKIKNLNIDGITMSYERFSDINNWYIETNNLWKIFSK